MLARISRRVFVASCLGCLPSASTFDLKAPRVVSTVPANGATGVLPQTPLQVCCDSPLKPETVTESAVALERIDGHKKTPVALAVGTLDPSGKCFAMTTAAPLSPASHYALVLKKTILGQSGIALGDSKATAAYTATFSTAGAPATGVLLVPSDGMLSAPLDLAQVVVAFDAPVALSGDGGPLDTLPGGAPSTLSTDGRLATSLFAGAMAGMRVPVELSSAIVDASGQTPNTGGPLWFTFGGCVEGTAPNVGGAFMEARDVDGWLQFLVDRPGLCGASVEDPGSPDAGAIGLVAAQCEAPYDPCNPSGACECTVPIAPLGSGDAISATPMLTGYDGLVGTGAATMFQTSPPLPGVVLNEVFPASKTVAFVELQNRSGGPIDLTGVELVDCALSLGCASPKGTPAVFGPFSGVGSATVDEDGYALLVDSTFDSTMAPADAAVLSPVNGGTMVSLSKTARQSLGIFMPGAGAVVSMYDGSQLPKAGYSIERVHPGATETTVGNWAISKTLGGTAGECNSVTGGDECDP